MRPFSCLLFLLFFLPCPLLWAQQILDFDHPSSQDKKDELFFHDTFQKAQAGDSRAMGTLGLLYEKGLGCGQSDVEALKWFKQGARKGDSDSQNNLGFLYFKGLGIKENDSEALRWFQKAADQGLASAQENLGLIYARGTGVPKNHAKALAWFKKAAEQNDSEAQVNLAQMLSLGQGGPKDMVESYQWFSLALRHPNLEDEKIEELRNDIEWLEKRMKSGQIAEAKKRADQWERDFESFNHSPIKDSLKNDEE